MRLTDILPMYRFASTATAYLNTRDSDANPCCSSQLVFRLSRPMALGAERLGGRDNYICPTSKIENSLHRRWIQRAVSIVSRRIGGLIYALTNWMREHIMSKIRGGKTW